MSTVAVVVAAVLAVLAVLAVARPFLRDAAAGGDAGPPMEEDGAASGRLRLAEERDRALLALKELEFDHRTGKISDEDYRASVGPLRQEVARILRELDAEGAAAAGAREEPAG